MASWGLFKAPFKRYREETSAGVESTPPPSLVELKTSCFGRCLKLTMIYHDIYIIDSHLHIVSSTHAHTNLLCDRV